MHDQFDVTLEDSDLLGEVELTTNLIIAASEADGRLTQEEIDRLLASRSPAADVSLRPPRPRPRPRQQVANSTGPLLRSDRTYCPAPAPGRAPPCSPAARRRPHGNRSAKSPPCPGAGPPARSARLGVRRACVVVLEGHRHPDVATGLRGHRERPSSG